MGSAEVWLLYVLITGAGTATFPPVEFRSEQQCMLAGRQLVGDLSRRRDVEFSCVRKRYDNEKDQ